MIPKFRAWDKENKRMLDVVVLSCNQEFAFKCYCHTGEFDGKPTGVYLKEGLCELMQFTGLHDKNGVEIYEGDIVQRKFVDQFLYPPDVIIFEHNHGWHPKNSYNDDWWGYSEVIGNIYEHPHLLAPSADSPPPSSEVSK